MIFIMVDLITLSIGYSLANKHDFRCLDGHYIVPLTNGISGYLFVESVVFFSFSILIWAIFYYLPKKYGFMGGA